MKSFTHVKPKIANMDVEFHFPQFLTLIMQ